MDKGLDYMKKLKEQKPVFSKGHSEGHAMVIAGDIKILAIGYLYHALVSQDKGAPVEWVRNRPVIFSGPSMVLMKSAQHPNAAKLLLEWSLSPEGLKAIEDINSLGTPFPGSGTKQAKLVEGLPFVP